jgi:hypothetical protein
MANVSKAARTLLPERLGRQDGGDPGELATDGTDSRAPSIRSATSANC